MTKSHRSPVCFQALDLEGLSKPVPTVTCPARAARISVDGCAYCPSFRRLALDQDKNPVVCCDSAAAPSRAHASTREVLDVLCVPRVCALPDTPVFTLLLYLELESPWNIVPVIDRDARPVGVIDCAELSSKLRSGLELDAPLHDAMNTAFASVSPNTRVCDAASLRPDQGFRGALVVARIGTLIGVVSEYDLEC